MFRKILAPVDFTPHSLNALEQACKFAQAHNAHLTILNVISIDYVTSDLKNCVIPQIENAYKRFDNLKLTTPLWLNPDFVYKIEFGEVLDVITTYSPHYDLIILGADMVQDKSEPGHNHLLIDLTKKIATPILMIPGHIEKLTFNKIVFAIDLKKIKQWSALNNFRELLKAYEAELHLLKVNTSLDKLTEKKSDEAIHLHEFFAGIKHSFFFIDERNIEEGILTYLKERNINTLALMPRHRNFIQRLTHHSITDSITTQLDVPLLTFHE
ncbi:universal stress protein [Fulvivirga sp. M361]|uniref:universal stress protein n=1 Tax=Fulvivirga sp. M361 TaxID=2594266 RepID=UPI00117B50F8|nr:universal stress protein [Fulvivirga sp. M361]TRX52678.1 universal stress protein [Fulvivirga sp. M361]